MFRRGHTTRTTHTYTHTHIHAYNHTIIRTHTHINTYMHTHIHAYMHTCMTCIHAYMHTCIHANMHPSIQPSIHPSIHPYIHTYIHPYIHTSIHPYIHISIHPYIHTSIHTYIQTDRHTDIQTYRQTDIQTYRHTDRQTDTYKQLSHTQVFNTYLSPSHVSFLPFPFRLHLSFVTYWKKLTCGVFRSFNSAFFGTFDSSDLMKQYCSRTVSRRFLIDWCVSTPGSAVGLHEPTNHQCDPRDGYRKTRREEKQSEGHENSPWVSGQLFNALKFCTRCGFKHVFRW